MSVVSDSHALMTSKVVDGQQRNSGSFIFLSFYLVLVLF